jgi:hypothetical protein
MIMYHRAVIWGIFSIADIIEVLGIFDYKNILGYDDDLKRNMTVEIVEDCHRFQIDLDRLNEWYLVNKFALNVGKCRAISFRRNVRHVLFDYRISGSTLRCNEEIRDLGVLLDSKMTFLCHIEAVITKSSRMLGFIKRVSREFSD